MLPPRAYIFIGLNIIRVLSIVGLILVFSSSILIMVDDVKAVNSFMSAVKDSNTTVSDAMIDCDYIEGSTVPNQPAGVFWAVLNRLLIIFQVVILFMSEIGLLYKFFDRFFPVLGTDFGLGPVGLFQGFIGAAVLSHHVDDFSLVAAFFLFSIACINMLLGLIFRESAKARRSITTWRTEKKQGLLPIVQEKIGERAGPLKPIFTGQPPSFMSRATVVDHDEKVDLDYVNEKAGYLERGMGWGRQAEKFAASKNMILTRPLEALPPYGTGPRAQNRTRNSSDSHASNTSHPTFKSSNTAL